MNGCYDTGVLLKLYTAELESPAVQAFVHYRAQAIQFTELHHAECVSALCLKQFRGECTATEVTGALKLLEDDLRAGVLLRVALEWNQVWKQCRCLTEAHAALTGCRTLDAIHVACALVLGAREFITSDYRQPPFAIMAGLSVTDPTRAER
jgi:predicted nucleic acid-binding protein